MFNYKISGKIWDNDFIQLVAQMYLLRENGYSCIHSYIYYRESKQKVKIHWQDFYIEILKIALIRIRELSNSTRPEPLINSKKCIRCSLNEVCLPDETNLILNKTNTVRRILPSRYDTGILHITSSHVNVGVSGDNLVIKEKGKILNEFHLKDIFSISIYGNAQVSTQAISACLDEGISLSYFSSSGWMKGSISNFNGKNVDYRLLQYKNFEKLSLKLSKSLIKAKILNQRAFLRRNGQISEVDYSSLKELSKEVEDVDNLESLRGIEGMAAKIYFKNFSSMISEEMRSLFNFENRNRRPPLDPVNALISFGYSMLVKDCVNACIVVGLDPYYGFFHQIERGRPSLALDLMEIFRAIWVDSAVIRMINTKMINLNDFQITNSGCVMNSNAKKALIQSYEARSDRFITHPLFDYPMSYRRILEVEIRLLIRYLEGEISSWDPLTVR